ncbi:MAG: type 11 methyltransferase [Bacillus sp. (in: firmicutes)]|nr:type 11 methyltransferase [Bacillus sp. (in: firmicutes)]
MVQQAQGKYPKVKFMVRDAIDLKFQNEFDAIFSNATLHWIKTPQQALNSIYTALKSGGRFVAEFGGNENVRTITDEIFNQYEKLGIKYEMEQFPWYFPTIGEYTTMMEKIGFKVTFAHHFDRPTPLEGVNGLRNWLNMFGSGLFGDIDETTKDIVIANCEDSLRKLLYKDGSWIADYKRIRVIGIK